MALTISQIQSTRAVPGRAKLYSLAGGINIWCRINAPTQKHPQGLKSWLWRGLFRGSEIQVAIRVQAVQDLKKYLLQQGAKIQELVDRGVDPRITDLTEGVPLAKEVWAEYYAEKLSNPALNSPVYGHNTNACWHRHCATILGDLPISHISTSAADRCIDALVGRGQGTTANQVQKMISAFWRWAKRRYPEHMKGQDCPTLGRKQQEEDPLEFSLSAEDLAAIGAAWKASTNPDRWAVLWMLLVGSRIGVLPVLQRSWLDGPFLQIPKRTVGAKGARWIVQGPVALKLLEDAPLPITDARIRAVLTEICEAAGVPCHPHGLRSTMTTRSEIDLHIPRPILDVLVNHLPKKIDRAYYQWSVKPLLPYALQIEAGMLGFLGLQ